MGEIIMTIELEPSRVRKTQPRAVQKHKNKKLYSRKNKHKTNNTLYTELPGKNRAVLFNSPFCLFVYPV